MFFLRIVFENVCCKISITFPPSIFVNFFFFFKKKEKYLKNKKVLVYWSKKHFFSLKKIFFCQKLSAAKLSVFTNEHFQFFLWIDTDFRNPSPHSTGKCFLPPPNLFAKNWTKNDFFFKYLREFWSNFNAHTLLFSGLSRTFYSAKNFEI